MSNFKNFHTPAFLCFTDLVTVFNTATSALPLMARELQGFTAHLLSRSRGVSASQTDSPLFHLGARKTHNEPAAFRRTELKAISGLDNLLLVNVVGWHRISIIRIAEYFSLPATALKE